MKKKTAIAACIVLIIVVIVTVVCILTRKPEKQDPSLPAETTAAETAAETEALPVQTIRETVPEDDIPAYTEVPLAVPEVKPEDVHLVAEAEKAEITGSLAVEDIRRGCSGEGYVTGFSKRPGDSVKASFDIPASQHYDVTVSVCADTPVTNTLMMGETEIGDFTISESGHFVRVTFSGIYIPKGKAVLSIKEKDGNFCLDYFEVSNFTEMYQLNYEKIDELSDKNASANAKALMHFLKENYGKKTITGQYASSPENAELELIYRLTGKYPAIRFGALEGNVRKDTDKLMEAIYAAKDWGEQGGIAGLMWYWEAPCEKSSVFAKDTDFSLKKAMTAEDIALKKPEEIQNLYEAKKISQECYELILDMDSVSEALKPLAQADIPVLWRPLHEAGGDWFWWGRDGAEAYCWLWKLMYTRMTEYHGLHNLIWIWNGQSAEYLVDSYDVAAMDIYLPAGENFGSRYEQYVVLSRMTQGKKLLALSETSSVPDMNDMFRDNCIWSFFGLWYGEYLMDADGNYADAYTSSEDMIVHYNSEAALTLQDVKGKIQ